MAITKITEWEGTHTRLVRLEGLPRHPNYPFNYTRSDSYTVIHGRNIEGVVFHTTAGPNKDGLDAAIGLAEWIIRPPRFKLDEAGKVVYRTTRAGAKKPVVVGGGRGWPGAPYTFLVPHRPEVVDGKFEVYRLNDDDVRTWHTGGKVNTTMVAIAWAGMFRTRHAPSFSNRDPHETAIAAGRELLTDYLFDRYSIDGRSVYGHFDFGKPACPGDYLEEMVREFRGESVRLRHDDDDVAERPVDHRDLSSWRARQLALIALGYDVGKSGADGLFGFNTRRAVEAFQENADLVVDGVWGPRTENAVRIALALL